MAGVGALDSQSVDSTSSPPSLSRCTTSIKQQFLDSLIQTKHDKDFENQLLSDPSNLKLWFRYLDHKANSNSEALDLLTERILKLFPMCYKVWLTYLQRRVKESREYMWDSHSIENLDNVFERCLAYMNKMPRIWLIYVKYLQETGRIMKTRKTYDRSLCSLPVTQHYRIWPEYIDFINLCEVPLSGARVFKRYVTLMPEDTEVFINYLLKNNLHSQAIDAYLLCLNQPKFQSKFGKSLFEFRVELCTLISEHPKLVNPCIDCESIFRDCIALYSDQVGILWNLFAEYHIRLGDFEQAKCIYEEALHEVCTVADFTKIYDAYVQFLESILSERVDKLSSDDLSVQKLDEIDVEIEMSCLEDILDRHQLLLNEVMLRQNKHSIAEWQHRFELLDARQDHVGLNNCFEESLSKIDIEAAVGDCSLLWCYYSKYNETKAKDVEKARSILSRGTDFRFIKVAHLSNLWCYFIEFELRHDNNKEAMRLIKIATSYNTTIHNLHKSFGNDQQKFDARLKLHKDLKLWSLYADMEETLGTFETCRAVYESILHSGISTPQIIINFAQFLTENNYFEESFRVFEKGLAIFKWPYCIDIWKAYLPAFIRRKRDSSNTERIRDLFEKCLLDCPNNEIIYFADMYAGFEIKSAFPRRAVSIYQRMLNKLSANADLQYLLYRKLLDMIKEQFGVLESREVYQSALETLQDRHAIELGIEFAKMEKSVGEVDRARSIFAYTSQMANPAKYGSFWAEWQEFEVDHGNDDTVREMLRIKRSIQLQFANVYTGFITSSLPENENAMEKLETNALHNPVGVNQAFVSETIAMVQGQKSEASHHGLQSDGNYKIDEHKNPEEIVLDDENDSSACETNQVGFDTNQDEEIEIEEKPVPNFFQKYTSRSQAQQ